MIEGFEFVDGGRTYRCAVELAGGRRADAWWWFRVSSEDHQRFAPFRADDSDTLESVRSRIVAFYAHLLEARAMPYTRHWPRGRAALTPAIAVPVGAPVGAPPVA